MPKDERSDRGPINDKLHKCKGAKDPDDRTRETYLIEPHLTEGIHFATNIRRPLGLGDYCDDCKAHFTGPLVPANFMQ